MSAACSYSALPQDASPPSTKDETVESDISKPRNRVLALFIATSHALLAGSSMLCFNALRPYQDKPDADKINERRKSNKGYGISLTDASTARERYRKRRRLLTRKHMICDVSVYIAVVGLIIAIVDAEMNILMENSQFPGLHMYSNGFRLLNILLTLILDGLVLSYHLADLQVMSADTGHNTVQLGFDQHRRIKLAVELLICSICPLPGTTNIYWPILSNSTHAGSRSAPVPTHVLLTLPMFLRLYLVGRYLVLHSFTMQDAATRAIASLNQISVDFPYVLKTYIWEKPLSVVMVSTITFLFSMSWMLTQCERYVSEVENSNVHYFLEYAWFEAVTFFAIGYGDVEVKTFCGRSLAITTGVVGNITSSLITVLMGHRMLLSLSERRVNQVIAESQLSLHNKNAAARVLQWSWRTNCWKRKMEDYSGKPKKCNIPQHLRSSQRSLLQAILSFRRSRWRLRVKMEKEDDVIAIKRAFNETEDKLRGIRHRQAMLGTRLSALMSHVDRLTTIVTGATQVHL
uniref:CaMBD domain-containing protein n=1 Tax=Panagrellus redivivus TaxID=6233 RepID=A0A7E4UZX5_PANRE